MKRIAPDEGTLRPRSPGSSGLQTLWEAVTLFTLEQFTQFWWRAFDSLRSNDPTGFVGLQGVWDLNNPFGLRASLPRDLKDEEVTGRAVEQLLNVLPLPESKTSLSPAQISVAEIRVILNRSAGCNKFKTSPFAWTCFCVATEV